MNEETARVIAAGSVGLTVFGVGLAVLFCTRESRIRPRWDLLMLAVSVAAIVVMAAATQVHTNPLLAGGALVIGGVLGLFQGQRLNIRRTDGSAFARRGAISLAAWGGGMVVTQAAGIASRTQAMELGQAVSYLGAGMALGLIVGRQGAMKHTSFAPVGAAALIVLAVLPLAPFRSHPAAAQDPPPVVVRGEPKFTGPFASAEVEKVMAIADSEVELTFPEGGGTVGGSYALTLRIDQEIFDALIGAAISAAFGDDDPSDSPSKGPCVVNFTITGPLTGSLSGAVISAQGGLSAFDQQIVRGCQGYDLSMDEDFLGLDLRGTWDPAARVVRGTLFEPDDDEFVLEFTAVEEETEDEPTPAAAPASGANDPDGDEDDDDEDSARDPGLGGDDDGEVTEEEAAGAGIVGALAAAIAAVIAGLTGAGAGAAAATGAGLVGATGGVPQAPPPPGANGAAPPAERPQQTSEPPPDPRTITPENLAAAAAAIIKRAETLGETGIAGRVESLVTTGELTPEQAEKFKAELKRRDSLGQLLATEPYSKTGAQVFVEGVGKDARAGLNAAANLADKAGQPAVGMILRNPEVAARIAAAIGTGGTSEMVLTGAEIAQKVYTEATSPGENLDNTGAGIELTKIIGWEVGKEVVMDKLGGAVIEKLGAAGKSLAPGLFDDAAGAGAKALPGSSVDDAAGAAARSGDEAAQAVAKTSDEAAIAGAKADAPALGNSPRAGATPDGPSAAARGGDDVAGAATKADASGTASAAAGSGDDVAGAATKADVPGATTPRAGATPDGPSAAARGGDDVAGAATKADVPTAATSGASVAPDSPSGAARSGDDVAGAATKADAPTPRPAVTPRRAPELGPSPAPQVDPKDVNVDDQWLKGAPHGTKLPADRLDETGWTPSERAGIQKTSADRGVAISGRVTNTDSLRHPTANPKPEPVKGKTIIPEDIPLGARASDRGLAASFPPKYPGDGAPPAVLDRYHTRMTEWNATVDKLAGLKEKGIHWDPGSGLFTDSAGVPFRGDIDLVQVTRLSDGKVLTGQELQDVIDDLRKNGVPVQHGAESGLVRDIDRAGGDVDAAMKLHGDLASKHMSGEAVTVQVTPDGFQKGPTGRGMFDQLNPSTSPLSRGIPMELPDD